MKSFERRKKAAQYDTVTSDHEVSAKYEAKSKVKIEVLYAVIIALAIVAFGLLIAVIVLSVQNGTKFDEKNNDSLDINNIDHDSNIEYYDYIIIGGGISGLSQVAFLNKLTSNSSILLIERKKRLFGRIFTSYLTYNNKSIHFENNAMRFIFNQYLYKMFSYIDLCDKDEIIAMDTRNDTKRHRFFRNHHCSGNTYNDINNNNSTDDCNISKFYQSIYNFNKNDLEIFLNGITNTLMNERELYFKDSYKNGNETLNYTNLFEMKSFDEYLDCLYNWTLGDCNISFADWNGYGILLNLFNVSSEYMSYISNSQYSFSGFGDAYRIHAICSFLIEDSYFKYNKSKKNECTDRECTLKSGYKQLPLGIYNKIMETKHINNNTIKILLNTEVIGIESLPNNFNSNYDYNYYNHRYSILVRETTNWTNNNFDDRTTFTSTSMPRYLSKHVILSVPPQTLFKLFDNVDAFRDKDYIYRLINSVTQVETVYRMNLIYDNKDLLNYFKTHQLTQSFTDLPLNSIYFETAWQNDSLFSIQYYSWKNQGSPYHGLQQMNSQAYNSNELFELDIDSKNDILHANNELAKTSVKHLNQLIQYNNSNVIENPIAIFVQPAGFNSSNLDGFYQLKSGFEPYSIMEQIMKPIDEENIYVVISDYTYHSGWSFGGIQAAWYNTMYNLKLGDPFEDVDMCYF